MKEEDERMGEARGGGAFSLAYYEEVFRCGGDLDETRAAGLALCHEVRLLLVARDGPLKQSPVPFPAGGLLPSPAAVPPRARPGGVSRRRRRSPV